MTLKPLGDRVLVKPAPKEEKTSTGLYISSGAQEKPQRGEVVAVGAGKLNDKGEAGTGTRTRDPLPVDTGGRGEARESSVSSGIPSRDGRAHV